MSENHFAAALFAAQRRAANKSDVALSSQPVRVQRQHARFAAEVRPLLEAEHDAEVERLREQVEQYRASIVRLAQSWARHGKGAIAAELLTEFEMDEGEILGEADDGE